jgi:transposase
MSVSEPTLYVGFELSAKEWKLAMTSGFGMAPWIQTVPAGDLGAVTRLLMRARARLHLPATAGVVSCYEAGRDGFWIHRALTVIGLSNRVVDSASIEVNRRARRAKTDRIDAQKLVMMLVRVCQGERDVWREVRVPSVEAESVRHGSRERRQLKQEETRLVNQMRSWITTWGGRLPKRRVGDWWTTVADWSGAVLPAPVQARLARGQARLTVITAQLGVLDQAQHSAVAAAPPASPLRRLVQLKGVAATGATGLLEEGLVWRAFRNRREVGGYLGFRPMPFCSGQLARDQGIDRAGNMRLRGLALQLAWSWVRWQPTSALTQWFQTNFGGRGKRARRIGIVAVARKLLIALWRCATTGEVPTGAIVKVA